MAPVSVNDGDWGDYYNPPAMGDITLTPDTTYHLKASAQGDNVALYIDGQELTGGNLTLSDHSMGQYGVWMAVGDVTFDNVLATD